MKPRKMGHSLKRDVGYDDVWLLMLQRWPTQPRTGPDLQRSAERFRIRRCAFRSDLLATR